jgi:hypothetical protein
VSGAGGNSAGAVKTAGGDVYAGADGNVYKKTSSGWEKYDNGSWSQVQQPKDSANRQSSQGNLSGQTQSRASQASDTRTAQQSNLSGQTERGQGFRSEGGTSRTEGFGQLEQDREARMGGGQRQRDFQSMRGGGGFAGRGGGGFRR